ncbi:MAG TPA: hypothetical protein VNS34_07010 [Rhizobiaceae bacterium]|nr:hypothetical protein [Rhizobiaceae bacterium]
MNGIAVLFLRLAIIFFGYVVAAFAASAFLVFIIVGPLGWAPEEVPWVVTGSLAVAVPVMALFIAYYAFLPACVAIALAELLGRRDWLSYALAGGLVGAAVMGLSLKASWSVPWIDGGGADVDPAFSDPGFILTIVGCGVVGGIAYWLVAGLRAGAWRRAVSPGQADR